MTGRSLIGIDVGGTKTHIRVVSGDDVSDKIIPTSDWRFGAPGTDDPHGIGILVAQAHELTPARDAALVVGAHGCDSQRQVDDLTALLRLHHDGPILAVNDAALVVPAAGRVGIAVVAGTGSIVVGADVRGATVKAGGHGWMLSDPGSAPSITREAVRATIARYDRTGEFESLGRLLLDWLPDADIHAFMERFSETASMHNWASMAPLVFEAWQNGSPDAHAVVDDEASRLIQLAAAVADRGAVGDAVVATGGVVDNQPAFVDRLRHHTERLLPRHTFEVLSVAPVAGAIRLAATHFPHH